jgi:predicted transcriptional regulator
MNKHEHILISLAPRHSENIFAGKKQIELRRRTMHIIAGTIVWVYVTLPIGAIVGRAKVTAIHRAPPAILWQEFGAVSGLSESEFLTYLDGVEEGVVLALEDARYLRLPLALKTIREIATSFNPPQFFIRLNKQHPLGSTCMERAQRLRNFYPAQSKAALSLAHFQQINDSQQS